MKVGEYIRTKDGIIDKVIIEYNGKCANPTCNCKHVSCEKNYYDEDKIIKSSQNIIDLIEVGDYVNGVLVESIFQREKDKLYIHSFDTEIMMCFTNNNIKSIVTREMFESMEYKVGE